jgi:hypothetical protein
MNAFSQKKKDQNLSKGSKIIKKDPRHWSIDEYWFSQIA